MGKISSTSTAAHVAFVIPAPKASPSSVPHPVSTPTSATSGKPKAGSFSGTSSPSAPKNKPKSSSVNHGHASNAKPQQKKNAAGQLLHPTKGHPVNEKNQPINEFNQRVHPSLGYAINDQHVRIDKHDRLVNKEGFLIDSIGRPVDTQGKLLPSWSAAVKGDVALPVGQQNIAAHNAFVKFQENARNNKAGEKAQPAPIKNMDELVQRMMDAKKLVDAKVISSSPGLKQVAIEAAASATITGMISAPINVGAHAASTAAAEKIKAAYLPVSLAAPAPGTKPLSADDPAKAAQQTSAVETASVELEPENKALEEKMEKLATSACCSFTTTQLYASDKTQYLYLPPNDLSKGPVERTVFIESTVRLTESVTGRLAEDNGIKFDPYIPDNDPDGVSERLDVASRKLAAVDLALDRVKKLIG